MFSATTFIGICQFSTFITFSYPQLNGDLSFFCCITQVSFPATRVSYGEEKMRGSFLFSGAAFSGLPMRAPIRDGARGIILTPDNLVINSKGSLLVFVLSCGSFLIIWLSFNS